MIREWRESTFARLIDIFSSIPLRVETAWPSDAPRWAKQTQMLVATHAHTLAVIRRARSEEGSCLWSLNLSSGLHGVSRAVPGLTAAFLVRLLFPLCRQGYGYPHPPPTTPGARLDEMQHEIVVAVKRCQSKQSHSLTLVSGVCECAAFTVKDQTVSYPHTHTHTHTHTCSMYNTWDEILFSS